MSLTDYQATAVTLWVMMTHAVGAFETVPYLNISGLKGTGKSRLCEVLTLLVARPYYTERIAPVTLAQKIHNENVTVIWDEVDAVFIGRSVHTETIRGILNGGYRRSGKITSRENAAPVDYNVFGPKALAWKSDESKLPDTLAHRSIPITMVRKGQDEKIERFQERYVRPVADGIKDGLERYAQWFASKNHPEPDGLDVLSDRAADICEPLLQIAEACCDEIAAGARAALHDLCNPEDHEEPDAGIQMLQTIHSMYEAEFSRPNLFEQTHTARKLRSDDIARKLGINPWELRNKLRPYGIRPKPMRFGHIAGVGGYAYDDFEPIWKRYGIRGKPESPPR